MSQKRLKNKPCGALARELKSVIEAAVGRYGMPLGFGQFLRDLPNRVVRQAVSNATLLVFITGHALLIVKGSRNEEIPRSLVNELSTGTIRMFLIVEHLRRIGIVRVRYPRDPFTEFAEVVWWSGHPFVAWVLNKMPTAHGEKLKALILRTGDLSLVNGHVVLLAADEQQRLAAACEEMDRHLPQILAGIEQQYGDAQRLAWTGSAVIQ